MKYQVLLLSSFLTFACKEKPVNTPAAIPQPAEKPDTIQSGIYMGGSPGSCLCVNAQKQAAGSSSLLITMGTNLGADFETASDDMKTALRDAFKGLRFVSKEQLVDAESSAKYTRVQKANDCESLNTTIAEPVGYEDFCLQGKRIDKQKQF